MRRRCGPVRACAFCPVEHGALHCLLRPNSTPRGRPRCDVTAFLVPIRACAPEPGRAWKPSLFKGACQGPAMALTHTLRTNES